MEPMPQWFLVLMEQFADTIYRSQNTGLPRSIRPLAQKVWDKVETRIDE